MMGLLLRKFAVFYDGEDILDSNKFLIYSKS